MLLELANYSKDVGEMSNSQRVAIISLLHKGDEDDLIKNYRPISLLCVDVKIITKVMALRLQNVLQEVIDESQTAGIPGRTIYNNLWQTSDMLEYAKQTNRIGYLFSLKRG